jgi:hypothetical protein
MPIDPFTADPLAGKFEDGNVALELVEPKPAVLLDGAAVPNPTDPLEAPEPPNRLFC